MKSLYERAVASKCTSKILADTSSRCPPSVSSDPASSTSKFPKTSLWSSFFASALSVFETRSEPSDSENKAVHCDSPAFEKKAVHIRHNGWTAAVKKAVAIGSMRRLQERVLGSSRTGVSSSTSDIWFLGVCYKISQDESFGDADSSNGLAAFEQDFSSRILMTYRKGLFNEISALLWRIYRKSCKFELPLLNHYPLFSTGFDAIGDSKYTSDVSWGCMLRSSQMLVAQVLFWYIIFLPDYHYIVLKQYLSLLFTRLFLVLIILGQ